MAKVFFSYSHKDETLRNELETHLSLLKRQGKVGAWHDRRITAGKDIHDSIPKEMESAEVILLLVSANFLDSNYCFETEMNYALERHAQGLAVVIPVILHPCDWHSAPFGSLRATPTDGKPISMYGNLHEPLAIVSKDVREAIERMTSEAANFQEPTTNTTNSPTSHLPRSSNLAIKKEFNDHDRDAFLEDAFEYISRYFSGSLDELKKRNPQVKTRLKRIDETSFTAALYIDGSKVSACSIWYGSQLLGHQSICYSSDDKGRGNSTNEQLSVTEDGYELMLSPMGYLGFSDSLSKQGSSEHLWSMLIKPVQ